MEAISYNFIDKEDWPRGEWDNEPDKVQFQDHVTKLPCLILRNGMGALCGYVGVTKEHPFYGKDYGDELLCGIQAHGGLTYSDRCRHTEDNTGICHIPGPGEPDDIWWLGFDCAHWGDEIPNRREEYKSFEDVYRDFEYVKYEVEYLARQIKEAA